MPVDPVALVDLDRYPVTDVSGRGAIVADHHAAELAATGVSILPGFLRDDPLPDLVADAVAIGTIDEADAGGLVIIAAVWVDPAARDADLAFANNREAVAGALALGRAGLPAATEVVAQRESAWNPFYRPEVPR